MAKCPVHTVQSCNATRVSRCRAIAPYGSVRQHEEDLISHISFGTLEDASAGHTQIASASGTDTLSVT